MHFQAQNPTASDFPLPSVPSNTVAQSLSPRANHGSKFIQFSFSPGSSFSTFQHIELYASKLHWDIRTAFSALVFIAACKWKPHQSESGVRICTADRIVPHLLPNTASCEWQRVSLQTELPAVFTSTFGFFLSDWIHTVGLLEKRTFFLNVSI